MLKLPPLSLYVHIPWCVQKCPYCDFNSHQQKGALPHIDYVKHLLQDLEADLSLIGQRSISTIFIGGGTPSLLSSEAMQQLLNGIRARVTVLEDAEITMEANPGAVEATRFVAYQTAGINRISIGIQSFNDHHLQRLGRIHNAQEAANAVELAYSLNLRSFNLDLMHGLPTQTLEQAMADLSHAIDLAVPHLSWYQLTIEPNTLFASRPPVLPNEDILWKIYQQGHQLLIAAGYVQYETSAYAKPGFMCQHNLNYWRFGDYLGIGCGAHGKISFTDGRILRTVKTRHPRGYMQQRYLEQCYDVAINDRPFEFFMNRLRIMEPFLKQEFIDLTGLSFDQIQPAITQALQQNYLHATANTWQITSQGKLFLNSVLELFL